MELSFTFTKGETPEQIEQAIVAYFRQAQPAPVAAATAPAPALAPESTSNASHDASGVPYDARIHTDARTVTPSGNWRQRRGVDKAVVTQVMAELQAAGRILHAVAAPVAAAPAPAPLAAPAAPALPVAANTPFTRLANMLAANMHTPQNPDGRLTEQYINDALKQWGIVDATGTGSLPALQSKPDDYIEQVISAFEQVLN